MFNIIKHATESLTINVNSLAMCYKLAKHEKNQSHNNSMEKQDYWNFRTIAFQISVLLVK